MRSDPHDVVGAIELSRATYRKTIQNLVWATAYNLIAIPIAAGLFVRWGFDLPMSVGAVAMSLSTIIVAANAHCSVDLSCNTTLSPVDPRSAEFAPAPSRCRVPRPATSTVRHALSASTLLTTLPPNRIDAFLDDDRNHRDRRNRINPPPA